MQTQRRTKLGTVSFLLVIVAAFARLLGLPSLRRVSSNQSCSPSGIFQQTVSPAKRAYGLWDVNVLMEHCRRKAIHSADSPSPTLLFVYMPEDSSAPQRRCRGLKIEDCRHCRATGTRKGNTWRSQFAKHPMDHSGLGSPSICVPAGKPSRRQEGSSLTATNQPGFSLPRLPYCLTVNAKQYSVGL